MPKQKKDTRKKTAEAQSVGKPDVVAPPKARGYVKFNEADLAAAERKRAERALELAIKGLEKEGVSDYVVKVWRH